MDSTYRDFVSELTLKENLMLPMTFMAVDDEVKDLYLQKILGESGLLESANKYLRFLDEEESKKALNLIDYVHSRYPNLEAFLKALRENAETRSCLPFIQHELFMNIANDLEKASIFIKDRNYNEATKFLGRVIDRLTLRFALSHVYDAPSPRILEVSLLVIKNFYNLLKYKEKANSGIFEAFENAAVIHLNALTDSFVEIAKRMR